MKSKRDQRYCVAMSDYDIEEEGDIGEEKSGVDRGDYKFHLADLEEQFLRDDSDFDRCDGDDEESDVYAILAQKEKDLLLAAELGKALLEKNEELSQKYERLQEEYSQRAEELEQEKYELRLRLERIDGSHELRVQELLTDIHSLRNELNSVKSASLTDSASKRRTFVGLTEENEQLQSELSKLKNENERLGQEFNELKRQRLTRVISLDDSQYRLTEIENLSEKLSRIEEEKGYLKHTVRELMSAKDNLAKEVEELLVNNQLLQKNYSNTKTQLEDTEEKLVETKGHNLELTNKLDELKMQTSLDQTSRGSLFSELSDISLSMLDHDVSISTKLGLTAKDKQEPTSHLQRVHSVHSTPRPLATSSSMGLGGLNSNKRQRQHFSIDSDESDNDDLDYDDEVVDGPVARAVNMYEQLEKEEIVNAELRKEIADVHNELRTFYEGVCCSHESVSSVEPLDQSATQPGDLTSFVGAFKEVVTNLVNTSRSRTHSMYSGSMVATGSENLLEQVRRLKDDLYEAHKEMEHLREEMVSSSSRLKQRESEVSVMRKKLEDQENEIKCLNEDLNLLALRDCEPEMAFDAVYKQALKDKEEALRREYDIAKELKKTKSDAGRLDQQLLEAIQQKIELSEQLEEWQYDMASLIDEQVQKQMRTTVKEQDDTRTKRKTALFSKGWNWSASHR